MTKKAIARGKSKLTEFDKYHYYEKSVQNFENEVEFLNKNYKKIKKRTARTLKEDFCGTAGISCAWTKLNKNNEAWGIDLDPEPIAYGKANHLANLSTSAQKRMHYIEGNVLNTSSTAPVDICFAFNFSYFIFKKRKDLLNYFKSAYKSLNKDGVFFLDLFGGPESQTLVTDVIEHDGFKYYWECQKFNPLTQDCLFAIHFKRDGEKKRENVFTYSWRMWTCQELRDLLEEAGFKETITFWEGEDDDGGGDGEFFMTKEAENCDAWVTYIAAVK